jgi:hypothetical protein
MNFVFVSPVLLVRHIVPTDLASVHALVGDEGLGVVLEPVWVAESDAGERSACGISSVESQISHFAGRVLTTTRVVDNFLYDTPDVSIALRLCQLALCSQCLHFRGCVRRTYVVERAELSGGLVQAGVGREDRAATLSLVANDPTHGDVVVRCRMSMESSKLEVDFCGRAKLEILRLAVGWSVCTCPPRKAVFCACRARPLPSPTRRCSSIWANSLRH